MNPENLAALAKCESDEDVYGNKRYLNIEEN